MAKSIHTRRFGSGNAWKSRKNRGKDASAKRDRIETQKKQDKINEVNEALRKFTPQKKVTPQPSRFDKFTKSIKSFLKRGDR